MSDSERFGRENESRAKEEDGLTKLFRTAACTCSECGGSYFRGLQLPGETICRRCLDKKYARKDEPKEVNVNKTLMDVRDAIEKMQMELKQLLDLERALYSFYAKDSSAALPVDKEG